MKVSATGRQLLFSVHQGEDTITVSVSGRHKGVCLKQPGSVPPGRNQAVLQQFGPSVWWWGVQWWFQKHFHHPQTLMCVSLASAAAMLAKL